MANTGPVVTQVTPAHIPPVPPPPPGVKPSPVINAQPVATSTTTRVDKQTQTSQRQPRPLKLSDRIKQGIAAIGGTPAGSAQKSVQTEPAPVKPAKTTPVEKTAEGKTAEKPEKTAEGKTAEGKTAEGKTAEGKTAEGKTAEGKTAEGKTAEGKTAEKTSETKEQPITVIHKLSLGERVIGKLKVVGSFLVAPLKLIFNAVKFVTKPLQDYVITPAYEGLLYVFHPAKYNARKLEQKTAAQQAEDALKQEKSQAFDKLCMTEAKQRHNQLHEDLNCARLANHFGVTDMEVKDKVKNQKARAEANHLFNEQLAANKLKLHKEKVLHEDPKTGEKYYYTPTRTLAVANENNRATVTVKEKTPGGKVVDHLLDADHASVAMRLGNDPALATAMYNYNKEMAAYEQLLAAFIKDNAKYQNAKQKAAKKGKALDQKAPVHPGEPPKRPVFKCTDENVIAAFKLVREQYHAKLHAAVQTLGKDVATMMADFDAAYPNNEDTKNFINRAPNPEAYKEEVQAWAKKLESRLGEMQKELKQAEKGGNKSAIESLNKLISDQQRYIDINKRHLAIYAKECEKTSIQQELDYLNQMCPNLQEHRTQDIDDWKNGALVRDPQDPDFDKRVSDKRDRLDIGRLKNWVYKDAKGNALDIFTKDAGGNVTGVDKTMYAQVNDVIIPTPDRKLTPAYNGRVSAPDYQNQEGMKWSKMRQAPYQGYVAQRDENGKVLKDLDGKVKWEEAPGRLSNHWMVKYSDVDGRHEGYDKSQTIVKNSALASKPEASVVTEPETPVAVEPIVAVVEPKVPVVEPEVPVVIRPGVSVEQQTPEQLDSPEALAAEIGEKLFALTEENVHAHNELLSAKSSQPRVRTVDGDFCFSENSSEANDDGESVAAMPKHLFEREEREMAIRELIEQMPTLKPVRHHHSGRMELLEKICDGSPEEVERFLSGSRFVADAKDELHSHHPVIDSKLNPDDDSEYSDNSSEYSDERALLINPISLPQGPIPSLFTDPSPLLERLDRLNNELAKMNENNAST
ncbi:hypothetical protein J7438_17380 [Thalassotalea sp. G20_0]|uniref:hypothetical protein n=1 Tax=Thalassotalea sp. G20_0 TaxID=2821093 RepID=UPI001AD95AD1|nr:hypothetical protein [Thalassotalea sp. G20_0]MBO9495838.1 hypothetical protein [Thalassotalea sp. G20_0]